MSERTDASNIDLNLIRVLELLITERSVSRTALLLQTSQPAVSSQLRRLRALTGDALLVRAGNAMVPTDTALQMLEPASRILADAQKVFGARAVHRDFVPATSAMIFRIAASDYLDPLFLPDLVTHLKRAAPAVRIEMIPLSGGFDYRRALASGEVDLVIGNWLEPPGELHLRRLLVDEVVCLVANDHPVTRIAATRGWTAERYLNCEHVAPSPLHANAPGIIDEHLASVGAERQVVVRCAHFSLIPMMVARGLLVLTTGRLFCSRYVDALPVRIVRCPIAFPPMSYYQLWHDLSHGSAAARWLREQVLAVASRLGTRELAWRTPTRSAGSAS